MSDAPQGPRPVRRERKVARLGCWLRSGDREALGVTLNISSRGFQVRVAEDKAADFEAASALHFQLMLPNKEKPVSGEAEVIWRSRARSELHFGLEIRTMSPDALDRLNASLDGLRPVVLLIDEDPDHAEAYRALAQDHHVLRATSSAEALKVLGEHEVAVLITDEQLSDMHCLPFLQLVSQKHPKARCSRIVVSDYTVAGQLRILLNEGRVFAYLRKPFAWPHLQQAVRRGLDAYSLSVENAVLTTELRRAHHRLLFDNAFLRQRALGFEGFEQIIGRSKEMRRVLDELARLRRTDTTGHIYGETGTGKELVARAIHLGGPRAGNPFVVQSCGGLSEGLLQSTMFGHRKGAFTGALNDHLGVFQQAHTGTLFLDEVSELPLSAQAALLRAIQEGEVTPVGASSPVKVDVRLLSASKVDLRAAVKDGRFREDLYFRLVVVATRLPPLRERVDDIPILAAHFLDLQCERQGKNVRGFTLDAMRAFERYGWPGNVRELENEIERLVVHAEPGQKIALELLSGHIRGLRPEVPAAPDQPGQAFLVPFDHGYDGALEFLQQALLRRALALEGGNVTRAATRLRMDRSRLSKLRDRLGGPK